MKRKPTSQDRINIREKLNDDWKKSASSVLLRRSARRELSNIVYKFRDKSHRKKTKRLAKKQNSRTKSKKLLQDKPKYDYREYIVSKRWYNRIRDYYKLYGKICSACFSTKKIKMHHMNYLHIGYEYDNDITPLCDNCHAEYHQKYGTQRDMNKTTLEFIKSKLL